MQQNRNQKSGIVFVVKKNCDHLLALFTKMAGNFPQKYSKITYPSVCPHVMEHSLWDEL
jgi:hypothetical protein